LVGFFESKYFTFLSLDQHWNSAKNPVSLPSGLSGDQASPIRCCAMDEFKPGLY